MKLDAQLTVRLTKEELEALQLKAERYQIPTAVLARQYVLEGLVEFDRKHEALVSGIESLREDVRKGSDLAAAAIAAACLLKDVSHVPDKKEKLKTIKNHLDNSVILGNQILQYHDDGKFKPVLPNASD